MPEYVLSIDQGTTSSRAIVFDKAARVVASGQLEHDQIVPRAGWVEHDPQQIWNNVREVVGIALTRANLTATDIAAVGITNQRETTVVWDRHTGTPVTNAIVWQDTRTQKLVDELASAYQDLLGGDSIAAPAQIRAIVAEWSSDVFLCCAGVMPAGSIARPHQHSYFAC